jgi:hypothetical protein
MWNWLWCVPTAEMVALEAEIRKIPQERLARIIKEISEGK